MRILLLCLGLLIGAPLTAQEMTPRAYWPIPLETQVLTVGALYTTGDIVPDPSLPVTGLDSKIATGLLGYLRSMSLFGRSANFILEVPYSNGTSEVEHSELGLVERDYRGLGDIAATVSVNLMGAPAMTKADFSQFRHDPKPVLGASLKVVAPTGEYEDDKVLNVGANRWAAKAELGYIALLAPRWLLELHAGVWLFGDNDDFLGLTKEQNDIYSAQAHLVHRFSPGFWVSVDMTAYKGGRSTLDDVRLDDLQRDSKLGLTAVFPLARGHGLKASWATGSVNDSDESFNIYSISYQRLF
ncbi:transporter [Halioglobus maricola]|uniref:Transporter n=1 Tax=Halioglobus maricola TaxID=2601894 RepID=A0A5P9NLX9_9GAMM|nr:transporter [Halioglobus maricola]QFU76821.1 transporter [Halioglobus maricola]